MSNSTLDMLIRAVGDFSDLDAKFNRFAQRLRQNLSGTGTGGGFNNPGWLNQFLGGRQTRSPQDFLTTIDRLERALLRTGQTSQRLNQIRLPVGQFQEATKYLTALERQIALLGTSAWGRDLRQRVTASHQNLRSPFSWDWTAMYGSAQAGHAARMRFYEQAFRGMEHPGGGGGGGGGGWGGGITAAGAWMGRAAGGGILRSGGALLGMAGVGSVMGALFAGYREHIDTLESVDSLYKSMGSDKGFKGLEGDVKQLGAELQLAASDAAKLAESFMRASGSVDDDMLQRAQGAGQFGRGYGLDPNNTASSFARAELVGYGNTRQSQREFAALLAQTIGSSGMYGRSEQILGDLVGEIENIATQQGRTASAEEMTRYATLLGNAYNDPALRGGGAQSVLGNIRALGAGRDMYGSTIAWGAFGDKVGYDPYKVARLQDESRWTSIKDLFGAGSDASSAQLLHDYFKRFSAGMPGSTEQERYAYYLREMGIGNIPLNLQMYDLLERQWQNGSAADFMQWMQKSTGTDIDNVNLAGLGDLQRMYEQRDTVSAEHDAWLRSKAEEYQNNGTLPEAMQQDLKEALAAGGEESAQRLRALMPQVVGYNPNVETDAFTNRKTTADLMTSLANLSSNMQPVIEGLKKFATNLSAVADYILTGNFDALKTVWESTKDSAGDVMGKVQNGIPGFFESQGIHRNPSGSGPAAPDSGVTGDVSASIDPKAPGREHLLNMIAAAESGGNYNAMLGDARQSSIDLTGMTMDEIDALQTKMIGERGGSAIGRYQYVQETLRGLRQDLGIKGDEKFTPEMQDRLATESMRRRGLLDWEAGILPDADFQLQLSQEWAGLPKDSSGLSFHHGFNGNKATISDRRVDASLKQAHEARLTQSSSSANQAIDALTAAEQATFQSAAQLVVEMNQALANNDQEAAKRIGQQISFSNEQLLALASAKDIHQNLPKFHRGGLVQPWHKRLHSTSLGGNEVPAILQAGEEVLTANDPRHVRNQPRPSVPSAIQQAMQAVMNRQLHQGAGAVQGEVMVRVQLADQSGNAFWDSAYYAPVTGEPRISGSMAPRGNPNAPPVSPTRPTPTVSSPSQAPRVTPVPTPLPMAPAPSQPLPTTLPGTRWI